MGIVSDMSGSLQQAELFCKPPKVSTDIALAVTVSALCNGLGNRGKTIVLLDYGKEIKMV